VVIPNPPSLPEQQKRKLGPKSQVPTSAPPPATVTYQQHTGNTGQRRQLQAKHWPQASLPTSLDPSPEIADKTLIRHQQKPIKSPTERGHINVPSHTANLFTPEQTQSTAPLSSEERAKLPGHAFWTANTVVNPNTGAALEYQHLKLGPDGENGSKEPPMKWDASPKVFNHTCPPAVKQAPSYTSPKFQKAGEPPISKLLQATDPTQPKRARPIHLWRRSH
jgi:hypothetical protein